MSPDVASTVANARSLSGLSARQAAILAGVSPSTVTRIEQRKLDPSVGVLEAILAACGYRMGGMLAPSIDLDAVRAARRKLEPELGIPATDGSEAYARRWEESGVIRARSARERAGEIAFRAAQRAALRARPGAQRFAYRDWMQVAGAVGSAGQRWALTGGYAAAGYVRSASVDWPVLYVEDVEAAADAAALVGSETGRRLTLIPFDDLTRAGVRRVVPGLHLASFWQVVIDCFAGDGRMPSQAEAMVDLWVAGAPAGWWPA